MIFRIPSSPSSPVELVQNIWTIRLVKDYRVDLVQTSVEHRIQWTLLINNIISFFPSPWLTEYCDSCKAGDTW